MHAYNAARTYWDHFSDSVEAEIRDRAAWEELSAPEFRERLQRACYLYGVTNDDSLVEPLADVYTLAQRRLSVARRTDLFLDMQRAFRKREIAVNALNPFCLHDRSPSIASMAAVEIATGGTPTSRDPLTWPRLIVSCIAQRAPASRAGVFAGLVSLGDARVFSLLDAVKWDLADDELATVVRCCVGRPCLAELGFWCGWAEEIQLREDGQGAAFGHCLSALLWLARDAAAAGFLDATRNFGYLGAPPGTPSLCIAGQHTLAEAAKRFSERLYALESREAPPKLVPDVLEAFGLAARSPWAERALPG